jgi:glycerophosphoryl diester phosphodiesterase
VLPPAFARQGRPLIWGHRGASFEAPENTLAAFELARRMGADGVELDAQRSASGEVVVLHDESLGRTTGFAGLVTETPYSVLRTLDAGARKADRFRGERVPLLAEVLAAFPLLVNIELKCERSDDRGLTAAVVRIVREARAEERVLLSSFNPLCLLRARLFAPRIARALLFESQQAWPLRSGLCAPALSLRAMHPEHVLATPQRVSRWRRRGYSVGCWTVDDPEAAARLYQSGVSGIITNRPDIIRARWPGG